MCLRVWTSDFDYMFDMKTKPLYVLNVSPTDDVVDMFTLEKRMFITSYMM